MASALARGFKTDAERISLEIRAELGLTAHDRLDPVALADYLGIPVLSLGDLKDGGARPESITCLMRSQANFSALTVLDGTRRLIVYNPRHRPGRRASSLAHELAHVLLEHPPAPALGDGGCRHWNSQFEEEANWLAAALLVPRDGALWWLRCGHSIEEGAAHFGASKVLFLWRVNMTGVKRQLAASGSRFRV